MSLIYWFPRPMLHDSVLHFLKAQLDYLTCYAGDRGETFDFPRFFISIYC